MVLEDDRFVYSDLILQPDHSTKFDALPSDLYSGWTGLTLALAYFAKVENDPGILETAQTIVDCGLKGVDRSRIARIGLCQGLAGFIYAFSHLASLWDSSYCLDVASTFADDVKDRLYTDRHFDIFSGAAGAILGLLSLHSVLLDDDLLSDLNKLVDHLLDNRLTDEIGTAWLSSIPSHAPTSGFAHGVSGIAFALIRANRVLNRGDVDEAIRLADFYLSKLYDDHASTWLEDSGSSADSQIAAWCHGLPGIAIYLREHDSYFGTNFSNMPFIECIQLLSDQCVFDNDSICHGTLGNIDVLISEKLDSSCPDTIDAIETGLSKARLSLVGRSARCGNRLKHHSAGLFTGFAGIAYQLLRFENASVVPSVASFDPPNQ